MTKRNKTGENIRIIREIKGFKQDYMALMLDISQSGYAKIESGKSSINIERLHQIAKVLEVDVNDLLNDDKIKIIPKANTHQNNTHQNNTHFNVTDQHQYVGFAVYEKLIKKQEDEIFFLRKMLEKR